MRRVGHAGTLDPMATGVLVVGVGPTTRLLGIVGAHDKEYQATIRLGAATTTDDREGEVVTVADAVLVSAVTDEALASAIERFLGTIAQRPSAVSAVKIDGKRAYERVRTGENVELPERTVTITAFDVLRVNRTQDFIDVDVRVECSAGTYIRALARDLGAELAVGGHLTALRRMRSGGVQVQDCIDIDSVSTDHLARPATFARGELPVVEINEQQVIDARHGKPLSVTCTGATALIGPGEDLVAIVDAGPRYVAVFPPGS
jgi:tRNA pseudouridine55 synthase